VPAPCRVGHADECVIRTRDHSGRSSERYRGDDRERHADGRGLTGASNLSFLRNNSADGTL